jgi:hypothetical protein
LNHLDITDKHKVLNVAVLGFEGFQHGVEEVIRGEATVIPNWRPLENDKELAV